jgi:hypothetical protein
MNMVTLLAHFDGEHICLEKPYQFESGAKLIVIVLPNQPADDGHEEWWRLSVSGLASAYGEDEPEYSSNLIKEPNCEYEGR